MSFVAAFTTPGLHGYSVRFSPFLGARLAVVSCQQYGISGTGNVLIFDNTPSGLVLRQSFVWEESLFDLSWSESNANIAVTAGGDGCLHIWDVDRTPEAGPVNVLKGHSREVYGVDWCLARYSANLMLSASWDKTVKLWNIGDGRCLNTFTGHEHIVYSAVWSPLVPKCFASVSGDRTIRIWDIRKSYMAGITLNGHEAEILSCDWSKYDQNVVASAATDGSIRVWDLRNPRQFLKQLSDHQYAVRRVKFSPFDGNVLLSCSYDFTVKTWNIAAQSTAIEVIEHHTEFVYGIDFNLHIPGQIADCSWDETVKVYSPVSLQPALR